MAKYIHLSRIYLGDEEMFELLAPKNIAHRELLRVARRRGLMFSDKSESADVRSSLVKLPSDYPTVQALYDSIARPDPEERSSGVRIQNCAPNNLCSIAQKISEERSAKRGENYNITQISPNTVRLEVTYVDVDPSRAVVYSRREKKVFVEINQNGETIAVQHTANERAKDIVNALKDTLAIKADAIRREQRVSLNGVRSAKQRSEFFLELIRGIPGYKYENTTHINVDRRFPENEGASDEVESQTAERKKSKTADSLKGLINKMALSGEQVMLTEIYQQVTTTGYYIAGIAWTCQDGKDSRFNIDCVAGFKEPVEADEFTFDIVRRWKYKPEAPDEDETIPMSPSEKRDLKALLETAAYTSLEKITSASEPNPATPNTGHSKGAA